MFYFLLFNLLLTHFEKKCEKEKSLKKTLILYILPLFSRLLCSSLSLASSTCPSSSFSISLSFSSYLLHSTFSPFSILPSSSSRMPFLLLLRSLILSSSTFHSLIFSGEHYLRFGVLDRAHNSSFLDLKLERDIIDDFLDENR
ncbi:hypothetical protein ACH5RR_029229 [Cinchona calisaya]|uniref:Uncharacterized protein n=1 Tax=Cinchona calisaya TaxID=153742 RepID=A0ABD2YS93_9GENT